MIVTLNGQSRQFAEESLTLSAMIQTLGLGLQPVLVELNGNAILSREFDEHTVQDGDIVEVIRMVAGG
jgi:thiamine biosynthesis protein ThiS